jgi:hypothetical protein
MFLLFPDYENEPLTCMQTLWTSSEAEPQESAAATETVKEATQEAPAATTDAPAPEKTAE